MSALVNLQKPLQFTHVKSPVASGSFACSSLRYLESVMISVLMVSLPTAPSPWNSEVIFAAWWLICSNVRFGVN